MKKALLLASAFAVTTTIMLTSCNKDFNCNCAVNGPDTAGISLNFDTTFVFEKTTEEIATTKCKVYEEGTSVLIPSGVSSSVMDINCQIQ